MNSSNTSRPRAVTDEADSNASARLRAEWLRLCIWCLVCVAVPLLVLRRQPPARVDLSREIAKLRAAQPEYIGIGNSMMYTRLGREPEEISKLAGHKFHFLYKGGSDPAVWYLTLKNIVAASGVRPKAVFLFVRDNDLTRPWGSLETRTPERLKELGGEHDAELARFMKAGRKQPALERLELQLADRHSLPEWRVHSARVMSNLAMDLTGGGATKKAKLAALTSRFDLDHLRADLKPDAPMEPERATAPLSREQAVQASLLPDMMRLAKECGAQLLVFRVKRRPDAVTQLPDEPPLVRSYSAFLSNWVTQHGGLYFDESYDLSIRLSDYLDTDHIHPRRLDWYRGYFWERMKGVFP